MATTTLQTGGRIRSIDIIRGIALFGILVINVQTYSLFAFLRPEQVYELKLDQPASYAPLQVFIHLFFKGEFYSIYSFLFGLGFYMMWKKNEQQGLDADGIFKRKLWVLLVFGLVHAFVFWFGDVLHKYALLGFTLIYFNKKSVYTILCWIIGLAVFVITIQVAKTMFFMVSPGSFGDKQGMDNVIMNVINTWQHGSVLEVFSLQKLGVAMLHMINAAAGFAAYVHYEIMFLLGLIAGKKNLFSKVSIMRLALKDTAFKLFPAAFILKAVSCIDIPGIHIVPANMQVYEKLIIAVAGFLGTPLLAIVYLLFMIIIFRDKTSVFWTWIANAGRMGLTNYLLQTLLCMVLFYGYAFALAGKLTLMESMVQVFFIYIFQIIFSNVWLHFYSIGPMESLWRKMTYKKKRQAPALTKKTSDVPVTVNLQTGWANSRTRMLLEI